MSRAEELREVLREVEDLEHRLDERVRELEEVKEKQRHLPGDLSEMFPADMPPELRR
jgi:hypothetical protein